MATLSLTVPDASVPRILAALSYDPALGIGQSAFVRQALMTWLIQVVARYEDEQHRAAALAAVAPPDPLPVS